MAISNNIVTLHSQIEDESNELLWGCMNECNQTMLSSPCIGLGQFDESHINRNTHNHQMRHLNNVACCTRDGTVFILPIMPMNQCDDSSDIIYDHIVTYQCPFDKQCDRFTRYLQGK